MPAEPTTKPTFPATRADDLTEVLHGHTIADPYRWLEDPDSEETRDWVRRQNAYTEEQFGQIPERAWFSELMNRIVRRPRAGVPAKRGGRYFVSRNDGSLDQDQIFVADTLAELRAGGRLILDPNTLSADGTSSVRGYQVSLDGHYLSYQVSEGGSDWVDFKLVDLGTGAPVDDAPIQTKFGSPTWLPDDSSYVYEAVPHTGRADGSQADQVRTGMLKLHRVGQPEDQDEVIVDVRDEYVQGVVWAERSADGRFLALHLVEGTENDNRLWLYRIATDDQGRSVLSEPIKLVDTAYARFQFLRNVDDTIILFTDHEAGRGRLVSVDLAAFDGEGELPLKELVAETADAVLSVEAAGEELIIVRLVDVQPVITRYRLDGSELGEVAISGGALAGIWADAESDEWFVGLSTVTSPTRAFRVQVGSGEVEPLDDLVPAGSAFQPPEVEVERRRATSADGTPVPYFLITPRAGDGGPRPTLLYGYGGFNIPVEADYRPMWPGWLAAGGAVVIANLRGGGEYGRGWYDDGRLDNKQHVFDDFIAVGDHLVATGVTTHDQLAIHGRSNGGLLVGATMTQRPDLAAVALPGVGVLDLLRFHRFTAGAAWTSDYGNPDDAHDFEVALAYSPLHNVAPAGYPATLIMTGDHDDRVVPLHSHKFTAALQQAQQGSAPILARIETQTGHGMGKPAAMVAAELADMLAFAAHFTGLQVPGDGTGLEADGGGELLAEVRVLPDRPSLGRAAGAAIADTLRIGLQHAETLRVVFAAAPSQQETLDALVAAGGIDWRRIEAFHMDEYLGLPDEHPSGFGNWLSTHLFDRLPFGSVHLIRPGDDPERAAADYAALLAERPVDLVVCGIGENGHIAFNDPPVADFDDPADVKIVTLDDACRRQQVGDGAFASFDDVPARAVTLTVPRLLRANAIVCVVPGANKRQAVTDALLGPVTTRCPASVLRTRPNVRLFLDEESGADVIGTVPGIVADQYPAL